MEKSRDKQKIEEIIQDKKVASSVNLDMEDEGEKCHGRMTTKVNSTIEGAMENQLRRRQQAS